LKHFEDVKVKLSDQKRGAQIADTSVKMINKYSCYVTSTMP